MDFTEFSVYGQRADLNRAIRDAERGAAVNEIVRAGRQARRARLGAAIRTTGRALGRALVVAGRNRSTGDLRPPSKGATDAAEITQSVPPSTVWRLR